MLSQTLYLCDLDGTLLNTEAKLPENSRKRLSRLLQDPEVNISFASARELHSLHGALGPLPHKLPLILANGAFVVDPLSEEIVFAQHFSEEQLAGLRPYLLRPGLVPLVYGRQDHGNNYSQSRRTVRFPLRPLPEGTQYYFDKRKNDPRFESIPEDEIERLFAGRVHCINLMDHKDQLEGLYRQLRKTGHFDLVFHQELYRPEWWLSIYPLGCNKGTAALALLKALGLSRLVVFGDGSNDIPLFEAALATGGEAYAVKNAVEALQSLATAVIGSNQDEAVPAYLENLIALERQKR